MQSDYLDSLLQEINDDQDGYFTIEQKNGEAVLKVFEAGKKGKPVELKSVQNRIRLLSLENINPKYVAKLVEEASGSSNVIGKWPNLEPIDGFAEFEISDDGMTAWATMNPPRNGGIMPTEEMLLEALAMNEIKKGIDQSALKSIARENQFHKRIVIAKGQEPIAGRSGVIRYFFQTRLTPQPKPDKKGNVDHRELDIIQSVKENELLAEISLPQEGEDGWDVRGHILPADKGQDISLMPGANTRLAPDGNQLFSNIMGRPVLETNGMVRVDEMVRLEKVDFSTGNVDFPGTIIVEERMLDGFKLSTKGSIYIKVSVGKVFLKAEKDIILVGGFMGRGKGTIEAGGDITARFVEQGRLKAGRNIYINEAAMHSELIAGGNIIIKGGRGDLIGGETIVGGYIHVNCMGAAGETRTRAIVGTPPELIEELNKLQAERHARKEVLERIMPNIRGLHEKSRRGEINSEEEEALEKLLLIKEKYSALLESVELQLESARASFEPSHESYLYIEQEIFPACEAQFGRGRLFKSSKRRATGTLAVFINEDNDLISGPVLPKKLVKKDSSNDNI